MCPLEKFFEPNRRMRSPMRRFHASTHASASIRALNYGQKGLVYTMRNLSKSITPKKFFFQNGEKIENRPGMAEIVRNSSESFWETTTETFGKIPSKLFSVQQFLKISTKMLTVVRTTYMAGFFSL